MQDYVVESAAALDKRFHDSGQSVEAFTQLIVRFTALGEVVLDPLCGGGTTGAAAVLGRRRFVGIEADGAALAQTRARLAALLAAGAAGVSETAWQQGLQAATQR
jgi:site-specific DNA-methyltransferase (adenine-specific)